MTTIEFNEMQKDLLACIRRVENGETLIVLQNERAVAEIKPIHLPTGKLRPFGLCAGQFVVPDDFDDPLPDELIQDFEGS